MTEKICDIAVIGGGGSGMVAAARAAELSGRKVIVLEKAGAIGGGMNFASTMRTFGSKWQKERGIPDQSADFMRGVMDATYWRLDPRLVKNAILGTGAFFDWYSSFESPEVLARYEPRPYIFDAPVNGQVGPQIDGFHNGSGRLFMQAMKRRCDELGVEILTRHAAYDVELEDGRIAAVLCRTDGEPVKIRCGICILACSTWIRNEEIVNKVLPGFTEMDIFPNAHQNPAYTGDGIPIAEKAGAFIDWDSFCLRLMGPQCSFGEQSNLERLTHSKYNILVSLLGRRFACEPMAPRMDPFDTGHVLKRLPRGRAFFLFSENMLESIIEESRGPSHPQEGPFAVRPLPELDVVKGWFDEGIRKNPKEAFAADTVGELAEKLGMDPAVLCATVDEYNASCHEGRDWLFCKPADALVPLDRGPYYALGGKLNTDGAFGGVRVNEHMQAYAADGSLVPGLYVTGDFASGRHISLGGVKRQALNDMSWALSSGFIAGTHAGTAVK
ncbi:MAG: FAD-binding protein [Oscillospiraceae bacterium]